MHINGSHSRRRIAHITLGLETGGQEKLLLEFARHADRKRFELFFLSLTTLGRLGAEIKAMGWPVVALNEPVGFRPSIALHIVPRLRSWRIDVVHTHDSKPLVYGAPAVRMAGVPRVIHTRHFTRLPDITRRQVLLARMAALLVDDYVCVSDDGGLVTVNEGVPSGRVWTIWNGIDLDRFHYAGPNARGPVVVVSRLSPEKDVATLVRAAALVVKENADFRLEIAGDGPCRHELRRLVRHLGIESNVAFLGEVDDIPGLLVNARLFALSSQAEGVSLTLLEAMARGLPVVTTRVGGNPEVVLDGKTGLLVPPRDPALLAQAILQLQGDLERCQHFGRAGRQRVEEHFTARRMVAAYEKLYAARSGACPSATPLSTNGTINRTARSESTDVRKRVSVVQLQEAKCTPQ